MGAFEQLRGEHKVILEVAALMELLASDQDTPDRLRASMPELLDFLRTYVDRNHHAKEELALFPAMEVDPMLHALAEVLEAEHDEARRMLLSMEEAASDERATVQLRNAALAYTAHMREHIAKENEMIFDAAERMLGTEQTNALEREFTDIEAVALAPGKLEELLAAIRKHC
jgi:hemerythrin-like domain-containing protein